MLSRTKTDLPTETEREAEASIGCAIEVHRRLGPGFLEGIYQDALGIELEAAGLGVRREVPIVLEYRGHSLRQHRIDLIVEHRVIVELKAVERLDRIHQAQLISYLRASRLRLGLLMNFNTEQTEVGPAPCGAVIRFKKPSCRPSCPLVSSWFLLQPSSERRDPRRTDP